MTPQSKPDRRKPAGREPRGIGSRARCKVCGYNGWTWLFGKARLCRGCARDKGYDDPTGRGWT